MENMDGLEFLQHSIEVLLRLRKAYQGDVSKQNKINEVLTELYKIRF